MKRAEKGAEIVQSRENEERQKQRTQPKWNGSESEMKDLWSDGDAASVFECLLPVRQSRYGIMLLSAEIFINGKKLLKSCLHIFEAIKKNDRTSIQI